MDRGAAIANAVTGTFKEKQYVLFSGTSVLYDLEQVHPWATGSATPRWIYNPKGKVLMEWNNSLEATVGNANAQRVTLPVLSVEIVPTEGDGPVQYDLTEFLEPLRLYCGEGNDPNLSVADLVVLWTASSGVVVDPYQFSARVMDTNAETRVTSIRDRTPLKELFAPPPESELEEGEIREAPPAAGSG